MSQSSPSEFLTFYRTIRATSTFTHAPARCLARPAATRPFSSSVPKPAARTSNIEDTLIGKSRQSFNLEDTMVGRSKQSSNLEDTLVGRSKMSSNLEDTMVGRSKTSNIDETLLGR